jgi:hypothetical protein
VDGDGNVHVVHSLLQAVELSVVVATRPPTMHVRCDVVWASVANRICDVCGNRLRYGVAAYTCVFAHDSAAALAGPARLVRIRGD